MQDCVDPQEQILLLTSLLTRLSPPPADAEPSAAPLKPSEHPSAGSPHVLLLSSLAYAKLGYGDLLGAKGDMDEANKILDRLDSVQGSVRAAFYKVASDYYKVCSPPFPCSLLTNDEQSKAEYAQYYKNSLLFLACVDINTDLTLPDRLARAHDLALSALLAETIYNFGELLMHPILDSLTGTQNEWLAKLLFVFNEGAIGKFEALAPVFPKEPILHENYAFLRQKICLMALIDAIFRNATGRTMTFKSIAEETRLPSEEVEHLVMKAMSLKLIRGSLDQVDETVKIEWVQPRVLDREQIGSLAKRLEGWVGKLNKVERRIEEESKGREGVAV
jgi:26S proteasome regulatory subunit N9